MARSREKKGGEPPRMREGFAETLVQSRDEKLEEFRRASAEERERGIGTLNAQIRILEGRLLDAKKSKKPDAEYSDQELVYLIMSLKDLVKRAGALPEPEKGAEEPDKNVGGEAEEPALEEREGEEEKKTEGAAAGGASEKPGEREAEKADPSKEQAVRPELISALEKSLQKREEDFENASNEERKQKMEQLKNEVEILKQQREEANEKPTGGYSKAELDHIIQANELLLKQFKETIASGGEAPDKESEEAQEQEAEDEEPAEESSAEQKEPKAEEPDAEQSKVDEPKEAAKSLSERFQSTEFFRKHFKGEVIEDPLTGQEKKELTKTDIAKSIGVGLISGAASIFGVKAAADLPRYLSQLKFTKEERARLKEQFEKLDIGIEEEVAQEASAVHSRAEEIRQLIETSKHLSAEKKKELSDQLVKVVSTHDGKLGLELDKRDQKIAAAIDEAIETRIKGSTVTKELINSALAVSYYSGAGVAFQGARSFAYGGISAYERYRRVSKEMAKGERKEGFMKEYFVNGVKETLGNLRGGGAETRLGKAANVAKAVGTLSRAAGFGYLAAEYGPEFIDQVLEKFSETNEWMQSAEATGNVTEEAGVVGAAGAAEATGDVTEAAAVVGGAAAAETAAEATKESVVETAVEVSKEVLETGTVKEGDGIVSILARQFEGSPEQFGFTGDVNDASALEAWANKKALMLAKAEGIVTDGHEIRLAKDSIGELSIVADENGVRFVDAQTGEKFTSDELKEMLYEYKYGAGAAPSEVAVAETAPEAVEAVEVTRTSEPIEAFEMPGGGIAKFEHDADGNPVSWDRGAFYEYVTDEDMLRMTDVLHDANIPDAEEELIARTLAADLKILDAMKIQELEDSAEYRFLLSEIKRGIRLVEENNLVQFDETNEVLAPYYEQAERMAEAPPDVPGIDIEKDRLGLNADWTFEGGRKMTFSYGANGEPNAVSFAGMTEKITDEERSRVMDAIVESTAMTSDQSAFSELLADYVFALSEMEKAELRDSDEYAFLLEDMREVVKSASGEIQFNTEADVFKDYLKGLELPEGGTKSPEVADFAEAVSAEDSPLRGGEVLAEMPRTEGAVEMAAVQGVENAFQIGPYGTVEFEYDGTGNVVGWQRDMKFGIFARAEAAELVTDGTGPVGSDLESLPKGQLRARREAGLEALAIAKTDDALKEAGYSHTSPERQFLRQELRRFVDQTNERWQGRFQFTPRNQAFRKIIT